MKKSTVFPDQTSSLQLFRTSTNNQTCSSMRQKSETVDIVFQDIDYKIKCINPDTKRKEFRQILKSLSGYCPSGQITAILGGSGAGKTSLLNILACRVPQNSDSRLTGAVQANGQSYDFDKFCQFSSYVMQNDILMETLTPRETFYFAAQLKFSDPESQQNRVEEILKSMKLQRCQNTVIGGIQIKGISGGERKRTSIGYQLVSNPLCILLDEPTSGLDSFTAFAIINELKQLAKTQERTIVFTIHSPSTDIFNLFDRIMLLANGNLIYQGKRSNIIGYFNNIQFECPIQANPMDYYLSLADEKKNSDNFDKLNSAYDEYCRNNIDLQILELENLILPLKTQEITTWAQIKIISNRSLMCYQRDPMQLKIRVIQAIVQGLMLGGVFWKVADGKSSIQDLSSISGSLFFCVMSLFASSVLSTILTFPIEREIFLKEENSQFYSIFSYFIAKQLIDIPMCVIFGVIQSLISYWMCCFQNNYESALMHILVSVLIYSWASGIAMITGCIFSDGKAIIGIGSYTIMPYILFCGFYANPKFFYSWDKWVQYTSPITFSFQALQRIEFKNQLYQVDPIQFYNIEFETWFCIYLLIGFTVAFRFIAFLILYFLKSRLQ